VLLPHGRLLLCAVFILATGCLSGAQASASQAPSEVPAAPGPAAATVPQRDTDVPELPFPDNPDPNQCGIPTLFGGGAGWVSGVYDGRLVEQTVLLYDSHERLRVTGAVPSGTQVQVELYQANPVLDFYYVRVDGPDGLQQGWIPAPFLQLDGPSQ
jgi:hypothetical protein